MHLRLHLLRMRFQRRPSSETAATHTRGSAHGPRSPITGYASEQSRTRRADFAGNGEPTAHPRFPEIITDTLALRDRYFPNAKVSVLTNSTFIHKPAVFEALNKVDNNILKLDTVDEPYIRELDRPTGSYSVSKIIESMKAFKGNCIIQTMFLKGSHAGKDMDNTSDRYVLPWLEAVKEISPRQVMIYTIDRETPGQDLRKATHEELDRIAYLIKEEGMKVSVSY